MIKRFENIVSEVAKNRGLCPMDMMSKRNARNLVYGRHEVFYRARSELNLSFPLIGRMTEFDHSTIMNGAGRHYVVINGLLVGGTRNYAKYAKEIPLSGSKQVKKYSHKRAARRAGVDHSTLKPVDPIKELMIVVEDVAKWIANGGTAEEFLFPYGLNEKQTREYMRRYLPSIRSAGYANRADAAKESLKRLALGKRLAGRRLAA